MRNGPRVREGEHAPIRKVETCIGKVRLGLVKG